MVEEKPKKWPANADWMYSCERMHEQVKSAHCSLALIESLKQEIIGLEAELAKVQHRASHDELTGLPNRSLLRDRLDQAMLQANRHKQQMGLLLLDLNDFKHVNDLYGHGIGDALLLQVAGRLVSCIRASDSAFRYGGDEFVILLPEVELATGVTGLLSKLSAQMAEPYALDHHRLVVTVSIGSALYPKDANTQKDLINHADRAMYLDKKRTALGQNPY